MKDPGRHIEKINKKVIHKNADPSVDNYPWKEEFRKEKSASEEKKQKKQLRKKEHLEEAPIHDSPEERNIKLKKRTPVRKEEIRRPSIKEEEMRKPFK